MSVNDITVAISTCNERVKNAAIIANEFSNLGFSVVILYQSYNEKWNRNRVEAVLSSINCKAKLCFVDGKGVAKSRNRALIEVSTKYIWFMDDDISLCLDDVDKFLDDMDSSNADFYTCEIVNEEGEARKKYPKHKKVHGRLSILKVGTIEIVCNVDYMVKNNILFPENMGAGTKYYIADEAVFLSRCLRSKGTGLHLKRSPISHPQESSGTEFDARVMESKAMALKEIFGSALCLPLSVAYLIKYVVYKKKYFMFFSGLISVIRILFKERPL